MPNMTSGEKLVPTKTQTHREAGTQSHGPSGRGGRAAERRPFHAAHSDLTLLEDYFVAACSDVDLCKLQTRERLRTREDGRSAL